jgi:SAM-dependent methyltransferase
MSKRLEEEKFLRDTRGRPVPEQLAAAILKLPEHLRVKELEWLSTVEDLDLIATDRRARWDSKWARGDFRPLWRITSIPGEIRSAAELTWFPPGASLLDVGCGDGEISAWLAGNGYQVTGIDFSREAIAKARSRYGQVRGLTFSVADICQSAIAPARFGALLDRGCLHVIPPGSKSDYVRNIAAAAAPAARFLLLHMVPPKRKKDEVVRRLDQLFRASFDLVRVADTAFERFSGDSAAPFRDGVALWMIRREF